MSKLSQTESKSKTTKKRAPAKKPAEESDFEEGNTIQNPSARNEEKNDNQRRYWIVVKYPKTQYESTESGLIYGISEELNSEIQEYINRLNRFAIKWKFGIEICPSTGRTHLQSFVVAGGRGVRWSKMKKLLPNIHFQPCKSNEADNLRYTGKDKMIFQKGFAIPIKTITELRPWQQTAKELLDNQTNNRHIYWFWDRGQGNVGKSQFIKWLKVMYNAIIITGGKKSDIINIVFNEKDELLTREKNVVCIDIPRNENNGCSYSAIEELKNGIIVNTKFEGSNFIMNEPHIFIVSNFYPDIFKISLDRWQIYCIDADDMTATKVEDIKKAYVYEYNLSIRELQIMEEKYKKVIDKSIKYNELCEKLYKEKEEDEKDEDV